MASLRICGRQLIFTRHEGRPAVFLIILLRLFEFRLSESRKRCRVERFSCSGGIVVLKKNPQNSRLSLRVSCAFKNAKFGRPKSCWPTLQREEVYSTANRSRLLKMLF